MDDQATRQGRQDTVEYHYHQSDNTFDQYGRFVQSLVRDLYCHQLFSDHEKVTCQSRCAELNRVMPSFALTAASIDMILTDSTKTETGDLVFPIDVKYDFKSREWTDKDKTPIKLPWRTKTDEQVYYPLMNDILLITNSAFQSESNVYTVASSTQCVKRPEKCIKRSFYCTHRSDTNRSELQAPMTHDNAISRCNELDGVIETRLINLPTTEKLTLWTGALRYNASHFKHHDDVLIEPVGFIGSFRDFPATVHVRIARDDKMIETYNSFGDAFNHVDSDYCLCFLNTSGIVKQLIQHDYFMYIVLIILASCFLIFFLSFRAKNQANPESL